MRSAVSNDESPGGREATGRSWEGAALSYSWARRVTLLAARQLGVRVARA